MKVIATKDGYDGQSFRREGEEFDMPDGSKGSWFKPVEVEPPRARKAKGDPAPAESDVA